MAELKELLEDEETKGQIIEWAKEQGFKAPDEIEGLVNKKNELLEKLAKTKQNQLTDEQRRILDALRENGFESADDLQDAFSKSGKKDDSEKVDRTIKQLQKQLEDVQSKYSNERTTRLTMEKSSAIEKAMDKAGIRPDARDLVRAYFDKKAIVEETDKGVSIIAQDDEGLGPPISDYVENWAKSDAGKNYVQKPVNIGAGVAGAGDVSTKTVFTRQELSDPKIAKQVMQRRKDGDDITIKD
jgi:hypothetical protein